MKKRHTCIICKRKRYENLMVKVFRESWACIPESNCLFYQCSNHPDIVKAQQIIALLKSLEILNSRHVI